jgi:hypothetical protein
VVKRALGALILAAAAAHAEPRAVFAPAAGGVVTASLPATILQEPAVRKQLSSGLTTVFLIVARESGAKNSGAARVEVRYDLWDEVWLVKRIEFDGRTDRQRLTSFDAFAQWWSAPSRLIASRAARVSLSVELRVLPFSAAEEEDARDWISKSGGVAAPNAVGSFVQTLIATTITARPIITYRWRAEVPLQ